MYITNDCLSLHSFAIMCHANGVGLSSDVAISFTILIGCVIFGCIITNIRLLWLGVTRSSQFNRSLNLSPYLVSCCFSDSAVVAIFGPMLCILLTHDDFLITDSVCALLDVLFLALFGATTISLLLYNLDRHCLLVQRRFYPSAFGKRRRNTINLAILWISTTLSSILYLQNRTTLPKTHIPMTFQLGSNMLYCVLTTVMLYLIPVFIMMTSLVKTIIHMKVKSVKFQQTDALNDRTIIPGILQEDLQTHNGVMVSSIVFILTSIPWVLFQLIKGLRIGHNLPVMHEIVLVAILVSGVGVKTIAYVICSGFIRKRFFVNVFRNSTFDFELPQSPVVVVNTEAV